MVAQVNKPGSLKGGGGDLDRNYLENTKTLFCVLNLLSRNHLFSQDVFDSISSIYFSDDNIDKGDAAKGVVVNGDGDSVGGSDVNVVEKVSMRYTHV
ncbi:hypothetical protein LOK49_LG03G01564 [Camellia lanceoleosa]|uniref:Uncharacterized protein n=1 Tax=Camellia lanceoleosa TaxID=1840588 RepID=A0ACC0IDL9_9ERIC|nr:hypothetical protein LOK49_LG03G01564 [Camellia lanceoleosa]